MMIFRCGMREPLRVVTRFSMEIFGGGMFGGLWPVFDLLWPNNFTIRQQNF